METLEIIRVNLFSSLVPAFILGMIATLVKSDVEFPFSPKRMSGTTLPEAQGSFEAVTA